MNGISKIESNITLLISVTNFWLFQPLGIPLIPFDGGNCYGSSHKIVWVESFYLKYNDFELLKIASNKFILVYCLGLIR